MNIAEDSKSKRIAVLSDHDVLFKAIKVSLQVHLNIEIIKLDSKQPVDDLDLIIVALGSPANNPLVALSSASLINKIGRVPILISSDNPHPSQAPSIKIFRLDFPFDVDRLAKQVQDILKKEYQDNGNEQRA